MSYKIQLNDADKTYTYDQDKIISPEETVARFREKTKKLDLDILSRTRRIDNGRLDIPIYFSFCGKDALQTIGTKKQMGKGGTPHQSEASAVMELAERFSFFTFCKDAILSKISFQNDIYISNFFINDDYLIVFGGSYSYPIYYEGEKEDSNSMKRVIELLKKDLGMYQHQLLEFMI